MMKNLKINAKIETKAELNLFLENKTKARKHCKVNEIEKNEMYYGGSVNCNIIM